MKILKYLSLIVVLALTASCEKHDIDYGVTPFDNLAEFQLHYFVPVTAVAANNITKVEINNKLYANNTAPLSTYSGIPGGSSPTTSPTGRFFTANPGTVNIKMYQGTDMATLVYDQNVTLTEGKQNVIVHDFNQPPVVFDNGYPYDKRQTILTDSVAYVKFYNFLYESAGVPTTLKLQYQYIDYRTQALVNIGPPVGFGESTGWQQVTIVKTDIVSQGSQRVDYRIKVVDDSGNIVGDLQIRNSSGNYVSYSDYWTGYIGRWVHHVLGGMRASSPACAVRQFWAL